MEPATHISSIVDGCGRGFLSLADNLKDSHFASQVRPETITDEFDRFKLWAGNIAAHRKGQRSLEYRLRDAAHLRAETVNLLGAIQDSLQDAQAIVVGEKIPWDEDILSDSDSDTDSDQASDNENSDLQGDTELKQFFASIKNSVTCLFRLSMAIRDPAPNSQSQSTITIDKSFFEQHDIMHVQAKYPECQDYLVQRLGRAISGRRQYLSYREEHHHKLAKSVETIGFEQPRTEHTTNSTEASRMAMKQPQTMIDEDDALSQTSFATSINTTIRVPPLPKEASKELFECPFCFMIVSIQSTMAWKQHVYRDLHPYCCTFEHCATADRLYDSRHAWFKHELEAHRTSWQCIEGCDKTFPTVDRFQAHVRANHPDLATADMLSVLTRTASKRPNMLEPGQCPLCDKRMTLRSLQKHLGHHQEQLALFALPPNLDQTEEDAQEGGQGLEFADDWDNEELSDQSDAESQPGSNSETLTPIPTHDVKDEAGLAKSAKRVDWDDEDEWNDSRAREITPSKVLYDEDEWYSEARYKDLSDQHEERRDLDQVDERLREEEERVQSEIRTREELLRRKFELKYLKERYEREAEEERLKFEEKNLERDRILINEMERERIQLERKQAAEKEEARKRLIAENMKKDEREHQSKPEEAEEFRRNLVEATVTLEGVSKEQKERQEARQRAVDAYNKRRAQEEQEAKEERGRIIAEYERKKVSDAEQAKKEREELLLRLQIEDEKHQSYEEEYEESPFEQNEAEEQPKKIMVSNSGMIERQILEHREARRRAVDDYNNRKAQEEKEAREERERIITEYERKKVSDAEQAQKEREELLMQLKIEEEKHKQKEKEEYEQFLLKQMKVEKEAKEKRELEEKELEDAMRERLKQFGFQENQIQAMPDGKEPKTSFSGLGLQSRPMYAKVHKMHLDVETLQYYDIPYEVDHSDPNYIIITREMELKETKILFEHTRRLRSRTPALIEERNREGKPLYPWVRRKSRSRRKSEDGTSSTRDMFF